MRNYRPWTPEEVAKLRAYLRDDRSATWIARAMGRSPGSVNNKIGDAGLAGIRDAARAGLPPDLPVPPEPPPPEPPAPTPPPDPVQAERERRERVKLLREERDVIQAVAGERSLRAHLDELVTRAVVQCDPVRPYEIPRARNRRPTMEGLHLNLSDWHFGETVYEEGTRGFNAYDSDIAERRVREVVSGARDITDRLRTGGWEFPRLVIGANGDFVSGTIHELERHSDNPNIVDTVYRCGMLFAESVRDLAADFPAVDVYCTAGNHGRLPDARRVQQKDPTRSWDTLVYLFAKTALAASPHIRFHVPQSYAVAYDIEGWTCLQSHGHDIKSWNTIPWYGINRAVANLSALEASRGTSIAYYFYSHFHQNTSMPHAAGESFINGSLIGGTEFTINALGKADRPCQWMVAFHPEHGATHRWPLWAEKARQARPSRRSA